MTVFEETVLEFEPGLNCITGETGAGKSLLLGAITLLMGAKAGSELVRPGCDKAMIEALFSQADAEYAIRREITAAGRSRCYINGELATLDQLASLTASLIQIYGQHQYQDLLNPKEHMPLLEAMAGLDRSVVIEAHAGLKDAQHALDSLETSISENLRRRDELSWDLNELNACRLEDGLEQNFERRLELCRAAAQLKDGVTQVRERCYLGAESLHEQVNQLRRILSDLSGIDADLNAPRDQLEAVLALLEDVNLALSRKEDGYEYDQQTIDELDDELHRLRHLKKKHGRDEQGLLDLRAELAGALAVIEGSDEHLLEARSRRDATWQNYVERCGGFLQERSVYAEALSTRINEDLAGLGMAGVRFGVSQPTDEWPAEVPASLDGYGPNKILGGEFMIATNRGQRLQPLAKIASGGELSRIMLALKVQQTSSGTGAMIFDEIDSGISGQTAFLVAERLRSIASGGQTIVVTHLHQVAAKADAHFSIVKAHSVDATTSAVSKLEPAERIEELARMMGGENPSATVIEHARELLAEAGSQPSCAVR